MDLEFPDLFAVVKPVVNRILVMRWATVSKHMKIPAFLEQNRKACDLVLISEAVGAIVRAADDWIADCPNEVLLLQKQGPLGDALFTHKMKDLVSVALGKQIKESLDKLIEKGKADKTVCDAVVLSKWREVIFDACHAGVASLELLPSRREVVISYRNSDITAVPVTCLTEHIEFAITARWKSAAIAAEQLPALDAEEMMDFAVASGDILLLIHPDYFKQAFVIMLIYIYIFLRIVLFLFL